MLPAAFILPFVLKEGVRIAVTAVPVALVRRPDLAVVAAVQFRPSQSRPDPGILIPCCRRGHHLT